VGGKRHLTLCPNSVEIERKRTRRHPPVKQSQRRAHITFPAGIKHRPSYQRRHHPISNLIHQAINMERIQGYSREYGPLVSNPLDGRSKGYLILGSIQCVKRAHDIPQIPPDNLRRFFLHFLHSLSVAPS
jgi:hypothetical protein